jgi:hypothetical protein
MELSQISPKTPHVVHNQENIILNHLSMKSKIKEELLVLQEISLLIDHI